METFDDVTVDDIIDEVNRHSTTKIVLADPLIDTRPVFPNLDIRDNSGAQPTAHNIWISGRGTAGRLIDPAF